MRPATLWRALLSGTTWLSALVRTFSQDRGNLLVVVLGFALCVAWPLTEPESFLGRADLLPWTALICSVFIAARAKRLGPPPHPQLTPLSTLAGRLGLRAAAAGLPWLLLSFQLIEDITDIGPYLLGLLLAMGAGLWIGWGEGETAWQPPPRSRRDITWPSAWRFALLLALVVVPFFAVEIVFLAEVEPLTLESIAESLGMTLGELRAGRASLTLWLSHSWLSGMSFVFAGLVMDRRQNRLQWLRYTDSDGARLYPEVQMYLVAALLPAFGILLIQYLPGIQVDESAYATVCYLGLCSIVIFPSPQPGGIGCILHEVSPVSLVAKTDPEQGVAKTPPEGTLRFNPQRVRRTRLMMPWFVRIEALSIPDRLARIRPLWAEIRHPEERHVFGTPFLPRRSSLPDTNTIIVTAERPQDRIPLLLGDNQERELIVYTPHASARQGEKTFRWEDPAAEAQLQHLDASNPRLELHDGSIIIVVSGLSSYMYEVELGEVVPADSLLLRLPFAQFQDHVPR